MLRILLSITICIVFYSPITSAFSTNASPKFQIVTSFSLLKNWADLLTKGISANDVIICHTCLVPSRADPHIYQPTPIDSKAIAQANVVIKLGLSFEGWIEPLIAASGTNARVATVSDGISHRSHPAPDPHIWHDVQKARKIVQNLAKELCQLMPAQATLIQRNAHEYDRELVSLDTWIRNEIAKIPPNRRKIITTHDAFYYYGDAYGLMFFAPVGLSTEAEVDSKTIANIIHQIRSEQITAIFFENLANRNVIRQIAEETGVDMSEKAVLYADSLLENASNNEKYVATMRHNTMLIVKALKIERDSTH